MVLGTLNKTKICEVAKCFMVADYAIYPDAKRQEELVVFMCMEHRAIVLEAKGPRQQMYQAASSFITKSLV